MKKVQISVKLLKRSFALLLTPLLLAAAADNAYYHVPLMSATKSAADENGSGTADIKVHVARDASGNIVHGYVDFNLNVPLPDAVVSGVSIYARSAAEINVPGSVLRRNATGNPPFRVSAPVLSTDATGLTTLKALLSGSTQFYVSVQTSRDKMAGPLQAATESTVHVRASADGLWKDADESEVGVKPQTGPKPPLFSRTFQLDANAFQAVLATAPMQNTKTAKPVISVPMPDGQFARFRIQESPVMEPALAAKVPNFKTYSGQGIDNPTDTIRFDSTNGVLHGIVSTPEGAVLIHPAAPDDKEHYIVFYRRDLAATPPSPSMMMAMPIPCNKEGSIVRRGE
jgi:hypothetical protein